MKPELTAIKIGRPAHSALAYAGILTLDQLTEYSEKELLALHGFGPKALGILKQVLEENHLTFKS